MQSSKPEETQNLKEKVQHGDIFFPINYYRTYLNTRYPVIDIHWHPEMEFTVIRSGSAQYSVNFVDFPVKEGDFLCIQPNLLHTARIHPKTPLISDSFVFHLDILGNASTDICNFRYFSPVTKGELQLPAIIHTTDSDYPQLIQVFEKLSTIYQQKSYGYELQIKACLLQLMELLLLHKSTQQPKQPLEQDFRLKMVFHYIKEHFQENISIKQAAALCCITPSHFMHYFREKTGVTFNQYLNQYRLGQAARLLLKGSAIAEAAYSCGFNNLPYFYRRFQEYYQMTPREFQKKELNERNSL